MVIVFGESSHILFLLLPYQLLELIYYLYYSSSEQSFFYHNHHILQDILGREGSVSSFGRRSNLEELSFEENLSSRS
jgi:hypothetical protein